MTKNEQMSSILLSPLPRAISYLNIQAAKLEVKPCSKLSLPTLFLLFLFLFLLL